MVDEVMWVVSMIRSEGKSVTVKKKYIADVTKDRCPGQPIISLNTPNN